MVINRTSLSDIHRIRKFSFSKEQGFAVLIFIFLLLGEIIGTILCNNSRIIIFAQKLFGIIFLKLAELSFLKVLGIVFVFSICSFLMIFILCSGVFGFVILPIIANFFGIFHGILAGYAYSSFKIQGITFNTLIFVPYMLLCSLFLIALSSELSNFSINLFSITVKKRQCDMFGLNYKLILKKITLILLLLIPASLLFTIFFKVLIKYFNFT